MSDIICEMLGGLYSDVTIIFNNTKYNVHIKYLIKRSLYFDTIYKNNMIKNNTIIITYEGYPKNLLNNQQDFGNSILDSVDSLIMENLLHCMYYNKIDVFSNKKKGFDIFNTFLFTVGLFSYWTVNDGYTDM